MEGFYIIDCIITGGAGSDPHVCHGAWHCCGIEYGNLQGIRREEQEKSRRNSICGTGTGNLCEFGPHGHYTYHIHTIHPVIHESTVSCGKEPVSVLFCTADRRDTACKRVSGSSSVL